MCIGNNEKNKLMLSDKKTKKDRDLRKGLLNKEQIKKLLIR